MKDRMRFSIALGLVGLLVLSACSSGPKPGQTGLVEGLAGHVVSDEPNVTVVGRDILASNGNAYDAAAAMGFALAVTLPGRAGLGGGGACLAFSQEEKAAKAYLFPAVAAGGDVAVPMMARGLELLHVGGGSLQWSQVMAPAEQMARFGHRVSRAANHDYALARGLLQQDQNLSVAFLKDGQPYKVGQRMEQPNLAATLSAIRQRGSLYSYRGSFPDQLERSARAQGLRLSATSIRTEGPELASPLKVPAGNHYLYLTPQPVAGGLALGQLWTYLGEEGNWPDQVGQQPQVLRNVFYQAAALQAGENLKLSEAAQQAALASVKVNREYGGPASAHGSNVADGRTYSAGFSVYDRFGNAITCDFSMNGLFGAGKMDSVTGLVFADAPSAGLKGNALLGVALMGNENTGRFVFAGYGGNAEGLNSGLLQVLLALREENRSLVAAIDKPRLALEPSGAVAIEDSSPVAGIYCSDTIADIEAEKGCDVAKDAKGFGLAVVAR